MRAMMPGSSSGSVVQKFSIALDVIPQLHLLPRGEVQLLHREIRRRVIVRLRGLVCGLSSLGGGGFALDLVRLLRLMGGFAQHLFAKQLDGLAAQGGIHVGDGAVQIESNAQRH